MPQTQPAATQPLALRRAQHALARVRAKQGQNYGKYVSYAKALPAEILQMGLGQALATLLSAAKGLTSDPHYLLYHDVKDWLTGRDNPDAPYAGQSDLMAAITQRDEAAYLHAQAEALAYLEWLKKFAVAFLQDMGGD
ncbi:type III-B CRISPR module-associated protein Cmr5 [Candidatus Methylocalor cossyra]|uniref:CRISPR type III-B/RAMP module-associated protein Cmr5 n=1 Tax=Candidatus Methylocalor cossyra TaxID=3108543 RepID=A0ABM9NK94_9GAMM